MRILTVGNMYPPHSLGGYELVWQSWVDNAIAHGHEVRALTTDFRLDGVDADDPSWVHRSLRWFWNEHDWPEHGLRESLAIERHNADVLTSTLDELRPDAVVWFAMAGMSVSMIERVRRAGVLSFAVLDDYWLEYAASVDGWQKRFTGGWRRPLGRIAGALTGAVVGVDMAAEVTCVFTTNWMRAHAEERVPNLDDAVVIPHPPPEIERFELAPERPWGWHLVYVGRLVDAKGVDLLVEAMALLPPEATLTIDGSGDDRYEAALRARVSELGLDGRVTIGRGPREDLPSVYASGDVTVFPVRWGEPFGLVPLESMAVGRPVVASGRGGSGELLDDGGNCLLFDPDDGPTALAARITELAGDEALRARLRTRGQHTVQAIIDAHFDDAVLALVADRVAARAEGAPTS